MRLLTTIFWAIVIYIFYKIMKFFFKSITAPERIKTKVNNHSNTRRNYPDIEDAKYEEIVTDKSERKEN